MIKKQVGLSMAVLALTSSAVHAMRINHTEAKTQNEELENDNGDDYMAESIAEAEKELKDKKGSVDMQKEIKQLEADSEVKVVKSDEMDVNQRKQTNKLTDDITAEALESKSILEYNGADFDVKQNKEEEEHKNFLSMNKAAIHEAYLDIKGQLNTTAKPAEEAEKKVQKKEETKLVETKKTKEQSKKEESESGSESESESSSSSSSDTGSDSGEENKKDKASAKTQKKAKANKSKNSKKSKESKAASNQTQPAALVQKDQSVNKTSNSNQSANVNSSKTTNLTAQANSTAQVNSTSISKSSEQANKTAETKKTISSNASASTNTSSISNATSPAAGGKYSLVDQFVKQYTAPEQQPQSLTQTKKHSSKHHAKHAKKDNKEHRQRRKHHHHHRKHDDDESDDQDKKSFVQLRDFDDDEDKEILESIKFAENKLGAKMGTPKALPKEHPYAPVKYDVEDEGVKLFQKDKKHQAKPEDKPVFGECELDDEQCKRDSRVPPADEQKVQLKDWDQDEDQEILDSIKFAENKLGHSMGTPKVLPKEHAYAPVKYDVEELSQKDFKYVHKTIEGIETDKGADAGDCDSNDQECINKSVKMVKKPADEQKLLTSSDLSFKHHKRHRLSQVEIKEDQDKDDGKDKKKDDKKKDDKKKDSKKDSKKPENKADTKKYDEKAKQKSHEKTIKELKPLLNDPKEVEKIKKQVIEEVEKDMKIDFEKRMEEVRKRTEEEVLARIAQETQDKKDKLEALKSAEEAADEAKKVAEKKAEEEELRKIKKAESKKEAMRMAIRRQADEILAKDEFKQKLVKAAHKYNLQQTGKTAYDHQSDSDSDSESDSE